MIAASCFTNHTPFSYNISPIFFLISFSFTPLWLLQFHLSPLHTSLSQNKTSPQPSLSNALPFFTSLLNRYASVSTPSPTTTTTPPTTPTATVTTAAGIRCSTNSSPAQLNNSILIWTRLGVAALLLKKAVMFTMMIGIGIAGVSISIRLMTRSVFSLSSRFVAATFFSLRFLVSDVNEISIFR